MRTRFAVGLFVVLFIAVSGIWGATVPIVNGSFESQAQTPPGPVTFTPDGWTDSPSGANGFLPPPSTWPSLPDGNQIAYSNSGSLTQVLTTDIAANTTYTLSVWVSERTNPANSFTPDIQLLDGSTPIITMTTSTPGGALPVKITDASTPYYTWVDWIGTFTSGSVVDGAPLEISLSASVAQTDFDNVTLDATSTVPEPAMFALVGVGLLGLVTRRRFAK